MESGSDQSSIQNSDQPTIVPSSEDLLPKIEGYSDLKQIGRGGTATVYSAVEVDLHRSVAIKVISTDDEAASRLEREIRALGMLDHVVHIVSVHSVVRTSRGQPAIVMPLFDTSLRALIRAEGPQSPDDVCNWVRQLASGIDEAHERGVIHRDVKPENVLLDESRNAYLADFGIATLESLISGTSTVMSISPPHAPPERLDGSSSGDVRGDIYSLASTAFYALAGVAPFGTTKTGGAAGLIDRIVNEEVPEHPRVLPAMLAVIKRAMSKDPLKRFGSAREFSEALDRAREVPSFGYVEAACGDENTIFPTNPAEGRSTSGRRNGHGRTVDAGNPANIFEPHSGESNTPVRNKKGLVKTVVGVATIIALLIAAAVLLRPTGKSVSNGSGAGPETLNLWLQNATKSTDLPPDFAVTIGSQRIPVKDLRQSDSTRVISRTAFKGRKAVPVVVFLPDRHEFNVSQTGKVRDNMRVDSLVITDGWVQLGDERRSRSDSTDTDSVAEERARVKELLTASDAELAEADKLFNVIFEGQVSVDYETIAAVVNDGLAPIYTNVIDTISGQSSTDVKSQTALTMSKECAASKLRAFRQEATFDDSLSREQNEQLQDDQWTEAKKACSSAAAARDMLG